VRLATHHVAAEAGDFLEPPVHEGDATARVGEADDRGQLFERHGECAERAHLVGELEVAVLEPVDQRLVVEAP